MPILEINCSSLFFSFGIQSDLCIQRSESFLKGCPNFGKKKGCPPQPLINQVLDLSKPVILIYTDFNIRGFAQRMKSKHPGWTIKQCYNPRYWQQTARKLHLLYIKTFLQHHDMKVISCPEAHGVNLHELMRRETGIVLEWPPRSLTRLISIAGTEKRL